MKVGDGKRSEVHRGALTRRGEDTPSCDLTSYACSIFGLPLISTTSPRLTLLFHHQPRSSLTASIRPWLRTLGDISRYFICQGYITNEKILQIGWPKHARNLVSYFLFTSISIVSICWIPSINRNTILLS